MDIAIQEERNLARPRSPNTATRSLRIVRRQPVAVAAGLIVGIIILLVFLAPLIAPYAPNHQSLLYRLQSPGSGHLLGTDEYGRDLLSRLLYGGRVSLTAGLGATFLATIAGTIIGLVGGYAGGWLDLILQRVMDAIMALPGIILLMVLATVLSPSLQNVIIAIAVYITPPSSRVVRGAVLAVRGNVYIEAARTTGASPLRVITRHILPNVIAPIIIIASVTVGAAILIEAALGFLGLSVPPPTATWGNMLSRGSQEYMEQAPWLALAPGLIIAVMVASVNLLGDGLRDFFDPRLRGS
ncbi:MAG: ABC transporter permease [Dehalococcoidia bacterium]